MKKPVSQLIPLPAFEMTRAFDLSVVVDDAVVPGLKLWMVQLCLSDLKNWCEGRVLEPEGGMLGIAFGIGVAIAIGSGVGWATKMSQMEDTADRLGELVRWPARVSLRGLMQGCHRQIEEEDSATFLQHNRALLVPLSRKSTT